MNIRALVVPVLLLADLVAPARAPEPLACKMSALTPLERQRYQELTAHLRKAVTSHEELPNGYALLLDRDAASLPLIAEWIGYEARCCSFLEFGLDVSGAGGPARLRLSGGPGVKEFLGSELGWVP